MKTSQLYLAHRLFTAPKTVSILLLVAIVLSGCGTFREYQPHDNNPLGWPARACLSAGISAETSPLPLVRDGGRLLRAIGDLAEVPAVIGEALVGTTDVGLTQVIDQTLVGIGSTVTAAINLPLFFVCWNQIDISDEAESMNAALAYIETLEPSVWRNASQDDRDQLIPAGVRVEARGKTLVWNFPDGERRVQSVQVSPLMRWLAPADFIGWERSWGFVVPDQTAFEAHSPSDRIELILHEFLHQEMQMRRWLRGWNPIYWSAYNVTFLRTGWYGHWAETDGPHAANAAERALSHWTPSGR